MEKLYTGNQNQTWSYLCDHQLRTAKCRLRLKKIGKTTRPFRYDVNQISYDYIVDVMNRFKVLDLVDRVPEELWTEVCNILQAARVVAAWHWSCGAWHWNDYEEIPHIQGQRNHSKTVGELKIAFKTKPPYPPETFRGLKQTLCAPGPRGPTETETELCLSVTCGGSSQQWTLQGQGLWVQQTWVWHKPSWRSLPLTPP